MDARAETVYNSYPEEYRKPLLQIRELIYSVANKLPNVGELEESLKWGQPTYSTVKPKTGTPIRLDRSGDDKIAMFFHCQTNLIENCKTLFQEELKFSQNRAIVIDPRKELPLNALAFCIELALTYHLKKSR